MSMYTFKFKTATVIVIPKAVYVLAVFPDTKINEFHGRWLEGNRQYYEIAEWAGYSNWCKYALEHELTHHC